MKKTSYKDILLGGLVNNNPTLVQLIGMCPTLAVTTSVINALGMGVAVIAVLTFSNLFISLLRKIIPPQVRIAAYIVVISGFVTAVELILKAYFPAISASLGLFIPLIVVNCIILARAEAFASKNPPLAAIVDGLAMGAGFTVALTVMGFIRELLGTGRVFADSNGMGGIALFGNAYPPATIFVLPTGAFITLAFLVAAVQKIRNIADSRAEEKRADAIRTQIIEAQYSDRNAEEEITFYDEEFEEENNG
ncbi:MAG: electron transport complex subunit E [Ruminococcaceae bacterium]|nr:electron transport complex subunit E [Oscillospiraceae bacterium]